MNYVEARNFYKRPSFLRKANQIENPSKGLYRTSQRNLSSINRGKEGLNSANDLKFEDVNIYKNLKMPYQCKNNKANNLDNEKKQIGILENEKNSVTEKNNKENKEEMPIKNYNINWFKYIWYLICCRSKYKAISYFKNIRSSLISEENILQNYLDIYELLKISDIPKIDIFNNIR